MHTVKFQLYFILLFKASYKCNCEVITFKGNANDYYKLFPRQPVYLIKIFNNYCFSVIVD